ncbi:MAG: hypothetical protein K9J74_12540 [Sulfuritalea sp.]|nr:hypothetical protein [Sulfuritalea sp.]
MRLPETSVNALTWLALLFLVPGVLIESPGGRFIFTALAGLIALIPLLFGNPKRRMFAAVVMAISLLMGVVSFPEFSKDQDAYRERVRQKSLALPPK